MEKSLPTPVPPMDGYAALLSDGELNAAEGRPAGGIFWIAYLRLSAVFIFCAY